MELDHSIEGTGKNEDKVKSVTKNMLASIDVKAQESRFIEMLSYKCGIKLTEKQKAQYCIRMGQPLFWQCLERAKLQFYYPEQPT